MHGIFQLDIPQAWALRAPWAGRPPIWEEGQIGIAWNVSHLAGEIPHTQIARACGMEDMRRGYACKCPAPGDNCSNHAAGAACDKLVTGFDHI